MTRFCLLCVILVTTIAFARNPPTVDLRLPPGYRVSAPVKSEFDADGYTIRLFSRSFSQGNAVYVEVLPPPAITVLPQEFLLSYDGNPVLLTSFPWGYRGLFPISPDESDGEKKLTLTLGAQGGPAQYTFPLTIGKTPFQVSRTKMNVGRYSNVNHAQDPKIQHFIQESSRKKAEAFARLGPDLLSASLAHPRCSHHVTSPFWSTRVYDRFEIKDGKRIEHPPSTKAHRGIDFRGQRGDPVYAMAAGEVVLAEGLYYEGKFTVIDHGNRIMSYYMHQDSITVKPGQKVEAGQRIGTVGNTGISTGPHLHVSFVIAGVQVDPLSILSLPIRHDRAPDSSLQE